MAPPAAETIEGDAPAEPTGSLAKLRAWTAGGGRRKWIVAGAFVATSLVTIFAWLQMAEIAVAPEYATLERALEALDRNEDEEARAIIEEMRLSSDLDAEDYGGAMFVLGVLKSREAERQWSPERSRTDHYVAAQLMAESRLIGFPAGREAEALFVQGASLVRSRQLERGVEVLLEALDAGAQGEAAAHLLLAKAYQDAPTPDHQKSLAQIDAALADPSLNAEDRGKALLMRATALAALSRADEAIATLDTPGEELPPARVALIRGKALVARLAASTERPAAVAQEAEAALEKARRLDRLSTPISRQSDLLKARIAELMGRRDNALAKYDELRRNHGSSPVGIAAALAEARLHQEAGETDAALASYRRALEAIDDPDAYRNPLLPLEDAQLRVREAVARFAADGRYDAAIAIIDHLTPLLNRTEQLALRAEALRGWGESLVARGEERRSRGVELVRRGRRRLREAGVAYEQLAEARFATRSFTDDLWDAADAYHAGQAYDAEIRVLERFLRHEPRLRNAQALLRLGQAHLSRGDDELAIATFSECLEFHPTDSASYEARLECAKAYRVRGEADEAERLLRFNLTRTALTPLSPEWRDSKFELGRLLADGDRHDDAIRELEEAVSRYRNDPQSRLARYLIAEAHRHASREPLAKLREAKTVNEREQARDQAEMHLQSALEMYQSVQKEITLADSSDAIDRATLRNCFALAGEVLFELGRYEEAIQSFSRVSALYQNKPYMIQALVNISHCWRRLRDRPKALGAIQQARLLLDRLPPDADFVTATSLNRADWDRLLTQLAAY